MKVFYVVVGVIIGLLINFGVVPYIFDEYYKMKNVNKTNKYKPTSDKEAIPITKGVCNIIQGKRVIDTYNRTDPMYTNLRPSVNRIGGTQFSYSFWLRRNRDFDLNKKILFFRGSEVKGNKEKGYIYNENGGTDGDSNHEKSNTKRDTAQAVADVNERFIKSPLVRFYEQGLQIEFNTIKDPHLFVRLNADIFKLLKSSKRHPKYNLITISFQDNFDFGGKERGIQVEVFIDDALVKTSSFENNALRMNDGPIILFPNNIEQNESIDADIANLTYHNYALTIYDIESLYNKGFANITCQLPDSWNNNNNRHTLSKINLYNETQQIM